MEEANRYKDEGNKFFNEGNYGEAATFYTKAISVKSLTDKEKTVFLKNRAACFLKLNKYHEAAADCTKGYIFIYIKFKKTKFQNATCVSL